MTNSALQHGNPFLDQATNFMPLSTTGMLRHAEFFAVSLDIIRAAYTRMAAYFLGDIEIVGDVNDEEVKKQKQFFVNDFGMWSFLLTSGLSTLIYGNCYASVLAPITRILYCRNPKCKTSYSIDKLSQGKPGVVSFHSDGFKAKCPACGRDGYMDDHDVINRNKTPTWRVWNPHDIYVSDYDSWTDRAIHYDWVIPTDARQDVKSGRPGILSSAPRAVLKAAIETGVMRFNTDYIHHWGDTPIPGIRSRGVHIPRSITSYRRMFLLQNINRQNEVITTNFITPFRVISPAPGGNDPMGGDTLRSAALGGNIRSNVMNMVDIHKRDSAAWHFSPIALQYQAFGADANSLVPTELSEQVTDAALNGIGMPVEFYRASMTVEQAPLGIRLFERFNAPFVHGLNSVCEFASKRVAQIRAHEPSTVRVVTPKIADDLEIKRILYELAMSGKGSWEDFFQLINRNYGDTVRRIMQENKLFAQEQSKFERDMEDLSLAGEIAKQPSPGEVRMQQEQEAQQQQQGGQPQQGQPQQGQPAEGGGPPPTAQMEIPPANRPYDAVELDERSQAEAKQLALADESSRRRRLDEIRKANPQYHKLVTSNLEQLRSKGRAMGQQAGLQQLVQGQ